MQLARDIVIQECRLRRAVQLSTDGGWHSCHRRRCTILHVKEHVCLQGKHLCSGPRCTEHPDGQVIYVSDVYMCQRVGAIHVCDQSSCKTESGQCVVSGLCCTAAPALPVAVPPSNKRSRRRKINSVHTNEQTACILVFDLLFSNRRVAFELRRALTHLELARRSSQRVVKHAIRSRKPLHVQDLVDIYVSVRHRMRDFSYIHACAGSSAQQDICRYYAAIIVQVWDSIVPVLSVRCSYESIAAAILYAMRKGVAYDGLYAIPADRFLLVALPDAHSIKDVGVARRALTQARNSLFQSVQQLIAQRLATVEQFAAVFKRAPPSVIRHYFEC